MNSILELSLAAALLTGIACTLLAFWLQPILDRFSASHVAGLVATMRDLHFDLTSLTTYLRVWWLTLILTPLVGTLVFGMPLVSLVVTFLVFRLLPLTLKARIRRQRILLRDQMVAATVNLANATRAGLAIPQGLESIIPETPQPLQFEFRRIVGEFHRGRPFADSLRDSQKRLNLEAFTLFTMAILVSMERGGRITDSLDRIGQSLLESQRLERKREADTASGRRVVAILAATPPGFLALFSLLDFESMNVIFTTVLGQFILGVVAVLDYISVRWARSILRIDAAAR